MRSGHFSRLHSEAIDPPVLSVLWFVLYWRYNASVDRPKRICGLEGYTSTLISLVYFVTFCNVLQPTTFYAPAHSKYGGQTLSFFFFARPCLSVRPCILVLPLTPKPMEYIHETSQMGKSYWDDVLRTRKTTLAHSVFEFGPGHTPKPYTVEPQWLEHLRDHGSSFETWVVRATEGKNGTSSGSKQW